MSGQVKMRDEMNKHCNWGWWTKKVVNVGTMPGHIGAT